jgi:hypothetical protein
MFTNGFSQYNLPVTNSSRQCPQERYKYGAHLPTPDWKDLKPGKPTSDIYIEQSGYNDANVNGWDGRNGSTQVVSAGRLTALFDFYA